MLTLVKFPTQLHHRTQLHGPISRNLSKFQLKFSTGLIFRVCHCKPRAGLRVRATEKGEIASSESDAFDFDEDYDDEDVFVPLDNMKKWLESKPRGFGEGKVYDTSIEDKLMEEIEQSRRAQIANVNKLKDGYVKQSAEEETSKQHNESEDVRDVFRVRLTNLPKKKNIHRDLRLAFEGVPGIQNIVPIVSGNGKTRDPVCKGLASVDFKNQDYAHRFVEKFSSTYVSFGKVQKKIKCEMVNAKSNDRLGSEANNSTHIDMSREMDQVFESEVFVEEEETRNASSTDGEESDSGSSKEVKKTKAKKKNKIRKLDIPGSAKRLKIREKAMLANVFTKYKGDSALEVAETK